MSRVLDPDESGTSINVESGTAIDVNRKWCELIDGEWVEKPLSCLTGVVGSNLLGLMHGHIRRNRLGLSLTGRVAYQLPNSPSNRIRKPDLSFVSVGRVTLSHDDASLPIAPDLAVELVSENETADYVQTKLIEYLRAGVRLVWVLYDSTKTVWAYRPEGTAKVYFEADTLPGEDVLPGFAVPVAELFEGV